MLRYAFLAAAISFISACPCYDPSWCLPINTGPRKEVLGYTIRPNDWHDYDWTKLTTLALFYSPNDTNLTCYAHSKGVRVVSSGNMAVADMLNKAARSSFIEKQLSLAKKFYLDGINLDVEWPLNSTAARNALNDLVAETKSAFSRAIPGSQVSFDIGWSPDCVDKRCYDAVGLAHVADFLVVMSYDERSQIWGPCVASANSPLPKTERGIEDFVTNLGIVSDKLVLGQPWYGYDYKCLYLDDIDLCSLPNIPFRGAPCSDAAGREVDYGLVKQMLKNSTSGRVWNDTLKAPYFNYKALDGSTHQVWYDDPESLTLKYEYGKSAGLRGLAFWTVDSLDYQSEEGKADAKAMWDAVTV
eukprot:m.148468 g.148468  ORF g.148468 m.148468 type:complete len:357 (+) comp38498_c1_seq15:57-1127(+)